MWYNTVYTIEIFGPHTKPHGARGLSKHGHMWFYLKIGHNIWKECQISCACPECNYMLYKPWIPGFSLKQKLRYQSVHGCTYWLVLVFFNNWSIIISSQKATQIEAFEDIYRVVLDVISDNMVLLVHSGKYGTTKTTNYTTMG